MWLSQKITGQSGSVSSEVASTTATNNGLISASSYSGEHRDIPIFSEFGYSAKPTDNTSALVIPFEDTGACVGFLSADYENLLQGEILIKAPSGAFIKLCSNGTVNINGTIFEQK
ncbi:MAG: hypothetical protein IJC83_01555 [Oscillospiraceae bacterium]|nr:hypothetical protein [Oscillospiraceae bacterium]